MPSILPLISQLADVDQRPETAKKIAATLGVKELLIFIRDDELKILLPAPGFPQTLSKAAEWRNLLSAYTQSGVYTKDTIHPITGDRTEMTTLIYKNKLAVILTGDLPPRSNVSLLRDTLPLLASLFHYEQYVNQAGAHIRQIETTATEHRNIAIRLNDTRKNLQSALQEKDDEIRERIKSELALALSEQRFRFLAEALPTMIFTASASGELTYVSPQWEQYTGLPVHSLRSTGIPAVLHPDDNKAFIYNWQQSYKTGVSIEQEVRIKRADGKYRWHLSRSQAMRDETGQITMWVGSSTDIEEVKLNMQKKLELEERTATLMRQQNNLLELSAAKDEFIRLASHQLRTPATSVKMYIGMLIGGYADTPTKNQMPMLDQAYQSNERQLRIIDDLLKVATIDAGKVILAKEKTDVITLIDDVITEMQHAISLRQQKIVVQSPPTATISTIDKRYIRMVIENIIDNASKYSPDNATITIKTAKTDCTEITITDQGVGIAKKDQLLLFKKFSRIHNDMSVSASGTGIGLYWAKEIVTLHGGTITLKSKLGHGSAFTIRLP